MGQPPDCGFFGLVYAESRDIPAAEMALPKCSPNPSDVSNEMAEMSKSFAAAGDIPAALRFADDLRVPGAYENGEGYLARALRDIAHAWVKKDGPEAALKWARSRPTGYQRAGTPRNCRKHCAEMIADKPAYCDSNHNFR